MGLLAADEVVLVNPTEYLDLTEPNTRRCGTCHTRKRRSQFDSDDECLRCENWRPRLSKAATLARAAALADLEAFRDSLPPLPDPLLIAHGAYWFARAHRRIKPAPWMDEGEREYQERRRKVAS